MDKVNLENVAKGVRAVVCFYVLYLATVDWQFVFLYAVLAFDDEISAFLKKKAS